MLFTALVDCNNFFASCERIFDPKLLGKPVVVLSNNDGCIVARSAEAKALGIPMGAPYFQWEGFMKAHDVVVRSSNFPLYGDISHRVMETLASCSPDIEIYSIDEAFLRLAGDPLEQAREIRKKVLQWTGIPVSIGIASTKTRAKVANAIAKKNPHFGGVFFPSEKEMNAHLDTMETEDIWGIGRRLSAFLAKKGIHTAGQLRDQTDDWIKHHLSVVTLRTVWELRGVPCLDLEEVTPAKQSIMTSRSFGRPVSTLEELIEATCTYGARGGEKLREEERKASWMQVFAYTGVHEPSQYVHLTLPEPTDYTPTLLDYASQGARSIFRPGSFYKKAGILLGGLVPKNYSQTDLFIAPNPQLTAKRQAAMALLDQANASFGYDILQFASEGITRPWKKRSQMCSPSYTTRWSDLLTIQI